MAVPVARLLPIALRLGAVAAAGWAVSRAVAARTQVGRTDQRAEDAMDDLGEGLAVHRPKDQSDDHQTNTTIRLKRVIRWGDKAVEVDAGLMGRLKIRKL